MEACGFDAARTPQLHAVEFYTSHEALHLPYEQALTRRSDDGRGWYGGSAHILWLGERTREVDGAHVEYLRGVDNPIGVKLGPNADGDDVLRLLDVLDPHDTPGRMVLISRMGADRVGERLRHARARGARRRAHAGVVLRPDARQHRHLVERLQNARLRPHPGRGQGLLRGACQQGSYAGGVHFEMTGQDVTECRGGAQALTDAALAARYRSTCDPRLNGAQSLELAFLIAGMLKARRTAASSRT